MHLSHPFPPSTPHPLPIHSPSIPHPFPIHSLSIPYPFPIHSSKLELTSSRGNRLSSSPLCMWTLTEAGLLVHMSTINSDLTGRLSPSFIRSPLAIEVIPTSTRMMHPAKTVTATEVAMRPRTIRWCQQEKARPKRCPSQVEIKKRSGFKCRCITVLQLEYLDWKVPAMRIYLVLV
ncbi:hypothetical protein BJ508DRAFT_420050 [Ascobolus immersus RN42]|uniref:Uncharacterized protein n=1 Tax=Ascobolus immersus RN42 TaxID=1160509 RepID=A0A3N4HD95_ASCIM|nr:hypothetical protein BJ508DRAFT_420050 [Ascobolus immersus RN42]